MTSAQPVEKLRVGGLYKVRYRLQSGNYRWYNWEMTAVFLGNVKNNLYASFSLRPHAGNTEIRKAHIDSAELLAATIDARDPNCPTVMPKRIGRVKKDT